jgi:hypothetical protein
MSFCVVPASFEAGTPWRSPTAMYMASSTGAVALIVIDAETRSSGMPSKIVSMSASESTATPTRPTAPSAAGSSESRPSCVGRSKAMERPLEPSPSR